MAQHPAPAPAPAQPQPQPQSQAPPARRQKRMGPAPFASFEDLSDELDSPEERNPGGSVVRLPGIREDASPSPSVASEQRSATGVPLASPSPVAGAAGGYAGGISLVGAAVSPPAGSAVSSLSTPRSAVSSARGGLHTPSTPRIDISRASSSSHHDSRDSTPDRYREIFEGHDPASAKLGLGFREDGALDLRSSTEELDFQDQTAAAAAAAASASAAAGGGGGSGGGGGGASTPGGSTAASAPPAAPGDGRRKGTSGASRSPSPHKMLLETSFCGPRPPPGGLASSAAAAAAQSADAKTADTEDMERVLLARKHDPTEAILAEGVAMPRRESGSMRLPPEKPARKIERRVQSVKSDITIKVDKPPPATAPATVTTTTPMTEVAGAPKLPRKIVSESGVEYIYIPLKGPLPKDDEATARAAANAKATKRDAKSPADKKTAASKAKQPAIRTKSKPETPKEIAKSKEQLSKGKEPISKVKEQGGKGRDRDKSGDAIRKSEPEPKYIRIKLKPDYMYSHDDPRAPEVQKPESLDLTDVSVVTRRPQPAHVEVTTHDEIRSDRISTSTTTTTTDQGKSLSSTPSASPKLSRHSIIKGGGNVGSKTPSPSLSRKSSFASLFRSKEAIISPESPTLPTSKRKNTLTGALKDVGDSIRDRSRSRSKSRERERAANLSAAPSSTESIDSKSKQKSVFSIFKTKKGDRARSDVDTSSPEVLPNIEGLGKVEFRFNETVVHRETTTRRYRENALECESVRIPLHSPTHYDGDRSLLQELKTSSQDSQETVIEAVTRNVDVIVEAVPQSVDSITTTAVQTSRGELKNRQSSTSSENVVFSTKLGSDNEIFTTKLPKSKNQQLQHQKAQAEAETERDADGDALLTTNGLQEVAQIRELANEIAALAEERREMRETVRREMREVARHEEEREARRESTRRGDERPRLERRKAESPRTTETEANLDRALPETPKARSNDVYKLDKELSAMSVSTTGAASNRSSIMSSMQDADERNNSSESERDSEPEVPRGRRELDLRLELELELEREYAEPERKGLVLQDSFEDELPYVPTTLPQERSAAVPIVPVRQRSTFEMKTCPIERPRSTTPINPSCLEEYCEEVMGGFNTEAVTRQIEKLKISLPHLESTEGGKVKSPRKAGSGTNWSEFAERGLSGRRASETETTPPPPPPPLPPKGVQREWINFEEIPERRKPPKRIQTIPSRGHIDVVGEAAALLLQQQQQQQQQQENVVYSYVNPEECKCECHELGNREKRVPEGTGRAGDGDGEGNGEGDGEKTTLVQEDELPLLEDDAAEEERSGADAVDRMKLDVAISDRRSIVSDSSVDLSMSVEQAVPPEVNGIESLGTPFTSDLGVSSNRSSIVSQDEPQSPDSESPNAFPKTS